VYSTVPGFVPATVNPVGMLRDLFKGLTSLSRRSRSVGEQSVADFQRRIAALRDAATSRNTTAPGRP